MPRWFTVDTPEPSEAKDAFRVKRLTSLIKPMLLWFGVLQSYNVSIGLTDRISSRADAIAEVSYDSPYRSLLFTVERNWLDKTTDDGVEEKMLHELLHPLLFQRINAYLEKSDVSMEKMTDLEEELVDGAAMWMWRLASLLSKKKRWEL